MNKIEFKKQFSLDQIFSLKSVRKSMSNFSYRQIDRWEKNGFLNKIKQGFYMFSDEKLDRFSLFLIANKIYAPSYISLETALKFYGLIPEEIFQITSISSNKTAKFNTMVGSFSYGHIKPKLFWGYYFIENGQQKILIAEPEKAILDYLYLHPELKTANDFKEMRIDKDSFFEKINLNKFENYLKAFDKKALIKRTNIFLKTIEND